MIIVENCKRLYGLLKHAIFGKDKNKPNNLDRNAFNLFNKGYYEFSVNIDDKNFDNIATNSIKKYFPHSKGDRRLFSIEEENEEIKIFFLKILDDHKENIKSVSTIKRLYLHSIMAGHLKNDEIKASSGGDWHIDQHFELFKIIIYLSDVDEANGPFSYIEGSHSKFIQFFTLFFFKFFSKNPTRFTNKLMKIIKKTFNLKQKIFTGKKGSCIIFNSAGIHRGLEIENGERISLTAYIFPFREDNKIIDERNKHMNIPSELLKQDYKNFVKL